MECKVTFVGIGVLDCPFYDDLRVIASRRHRRIVAARRSARSLPSASCFGRFRLIKTIINRFNLRYPTSYARRTAQPKSVMFKSHPTKSATKRKKPPDWVVFVCERAVKMCVNAGKNSKKYTKSKLFNASKKVRFVLWDKRLHICFTCAKRNYTFQKTSVIISPDIYLQGIFGQFLFIWIFILLGFFCKINYV